MISSFAVERSFGEGGRERKGVQWMAGAGNGDGRWTGIGGRVPSFDFSRTTD